MKFWKLVVDSSIKTSRTMLLARPLYLADRLSPGRQFTGTRYGAKVPRPGGPDLVCSAGQRPAERELRLPPRGFWFGSRRGWSLSCGLAISRFRLS